VASSDAANRYYDLDGQPISMEQWAALVDAKVKARQAVVEGMTTPEDDPTRIGSDHVDDAWVSTVWLGTDHNYLRGSPLIFETMIFGGRNDGFQARYATKEAALTGHRRVVAAEKLGTLDEW
jgi:hypothetical protein